MNNHIFRNGLTILRWASHWFLCNWPISHGNSHNAPVPHPTMHHSEQKCAHFCSEWCIVGYGTGALWDLWDCSTDRVIFSQGWCLMSLFSSMHPLPCTLCLASAARRYSPQSTGKCRGMTWHFHLSDLLHTLHSASLLRWPKCNFEPQMYRIASSMVTH